MSGRQCERCFDKKLGYCPFDFRCRDEVMELYAKDRKKEILQESKKEVKIC
jgi:hypothetical protein